MAEFLTIAEASRRIAARDLSPVELLNTCLARIDAVDAQLNSFVTLTRERAVAEAKAAEAEIMAGRYRGPLHGIPYNLKDIYETRGIRTTGQSKTLADYVPAADSDAQERLSAAGAVLLGKAATWEFAHGGPSWDVLFPPCRNPWNLERDPAGSSSGSGASIAAGMVLGSMGSDTGGSIRGPAAANGIAGLKPSYGRVSRRGVLPNCFSHDHAGPMAWSSEDLAILMKVVAGFDPADPGSVDLPVPDYTKALTGEVKGLTIGVPWRWLEEEAPPSAPTRAALDAALEVFRAMGATIRPVELPKLRAYEDAKKIIAMAELYTIHGPELRQRPELFGASLRYRIIAGGLIRAEDYIQAMRLRTELARAMQAVFTEVDLMMLPAGEPAKKLQPQPPDSLFTKVGYTTAFNVSGNPALALCMGFDTEGMPFSLQIVGRLFDEATVLRAGDAYEKATPWRQKRPALVS
ncbi:amidase [Siccirubricoccus sp. KC 17139]|uniref:Amidase n=1 Tax=Siccirubricoccus soli TaxID=2899147 RepID=A0ABT1D4D7_9PROT|nr:amidase [Siccirubricoccus soli]MCO6416793.1 amidase [Siccirubricoccus soli]MCP2682928.1 amidase [Siccirubricoccus soli]